MENTKDPIGQLLKKTRKERKVSVPELALALDIPKDRIYKWEKGHAPRYEDRQIIDKWLQDTNWNKVPHGTDVSGIVMHGQRLSADTVNITLQDYIDLLKNQNAEYLSIIKDSLSALVVNSTRSLDDLATVKRILRSDDGVIMDNQDRQAGREPGESATKAGKIEIAAAQQEQGMGKKKGSRR